MWEDLGMSAGTATIILIALYFIIKWAIKNGIREALVYLPEHKKAQEEFEAQEQGETLGALDKMEKILRKDMKRSNREIKSHEEKLEILIRCDVIRLGINTPDYPYIVPVNFGVESHGNTIILWLHCAAEGLKLNLIKQDSHVGFEADCSHKLIRGENACDYTMEYESVIGCGNIHICEDKQSKYRGMKAIMAHYEPEEDFEISDRRLASVCVLRLDVMQVTGKRLQKK